ncbi:DUF2207 domain-containing protein [uncultured Methanobrevibacter sp.]|uniref:DUF2207 domain-containing protein n=1 Tax=uncultured Methanobrevibacter sp. TaxID=253161 RepID=UPI002601301F|nr:DUF2207 domain-containing protein [uncultured Methanobrevibacter sp.]
MNKANITTLLVIGVLILFLVFGLAGFYFLNGDNNSHSNVNSNSNNNDNIKINDGDRDYKISNGDINLTINDNGLLHVRETYTYNFDGSYQGVKRNIPLKNHEELNNLNVYLDGAYGTVDEYSSNTGYNITTYLYSNEAKTERISNNAEVNITYDYEMNHVVKFYNDTAEFQYKIWGDTWDKPVEKLTAHINYPSSNNVEYWINPYEYKDTNSKWEGDTLVITRNQKTNQYLEINSLIPLDTFSSIDKITYHPNKQIDKVRNNQDNYVKNYEHDKTFLPLLGILELLSLIIPVGLYLKYGREPKIDYNGIYERETPSNDKPAFVNAMGVSGKLKSIGDLNENGFKSTIMDLINRKYLILIHKDEKDTVKLQIADENMSELESFEVEAINLLKRFEINGIIDFTYMEEELQYESMASTYMNSIEQWKENYKEQYINPQLDQFFNDKGARYIKYYGIVQVILSIVIIVFSLFSNNKSAFYTLLIMSIIVIVISIILIIIPNTIGGQWTKKGREYYQKWNNFKKYLKDFSLMKEYPPESIIIWNEYLVYATALGVADEVEKAMGDLAYSSSGYDDYSAIYIFYSFGGYYAFDRTFATAISTINQIDMDSIGDIGGGSGGGGGGAF